MQLSLDLLERIGLDDSRNRDLHDFGFSFSLACFRRGLVELPSADINRVGQQLMDWANPKALASPRPIAATIQPLDDFLYTKRARAAVPEKI
jgi:hypothetical protein